MSSDPEKKSRLSHPAWIVVLAGIPLVASLYGGQLFYDDAYITFRYAANIASGKGFVFNQEPVLGTTAPFYCLLLALAGYLGFSITTAAFAVGVLCGALAPVLVFRLGKVTGKEFAGLVGGLFLCFFPRWWLNANTGMETTLAGCLTVAVMILHLRGKGLAAGVMSGLLVLTRPDAAFLPLLVFIHLLWTDRKRTLTFAAGGIVVIAPWLVYSFITFGTPVPHSLAAKGLIHAYPAFLALDHYLDWFLSMSQPMGMAIFSAMWVLGAATILRSFRHAFILVAWPVVFIIGLSFTNVGPFPWYQIPAVPLFMFVAAYGIHAVYQGRGLAGRIPARYRRAACGVLAGTMIFLQLFEVAPLLASRQELDGLRQKEQTLKQMAKRIDERVRQRSLDPKEVKVLVGEVGVLGYELPDYRIIDSSGINSPDIYRLRKRDWERMKKDHPGYGWEEKWGGSIKWVRKTIRKYEPDFIASNLEYLHLRTLLDDPGFRKRYRLVEKWPFQEQEKQKVMVLLSRKSPERETNSGSESRESLK
ncbi:MAG: glycosyltransferase family 39 protein [bacterium]